MRAAFILFTDKGDRVPFFSERTPDAKGKVVEIGKHGWKVKRDWTPGFFVLRVGKHYRVGRVWRSQGGAITGSVYQLRAYDWQPNQWLLDTKFPNVASVEMYLRHTNGQS